MMRVKMHLLPGSGLARLARGTPKALSLSKEAENWPSQQLWEVAQTDHGLGCI